jgi:hypothetical protein
MIYEWWYLVAADLISEYGFNPYDVDQLRRCRWSGFKVMINGIFAADTRTARKYDHEYGSKK